MTDLQKIEAHASTINTRLEKFEHQMQQIADVLTFADEEPTNIIVTVAPGVYYQASTQKFFLYVGCGVIVEKTRDAIKKDLFEQLQLHDEYHQKLTVQLVELAMAADHAKGGK